MKRRAGRRLLIRPVVGLVYRSTVGGLPGSAIHGPAAVAGVVPASARADNEVSRDAGYRDIERLLDALGRRDAADIGARPEWPGRLVDAVVGHDTARNLVAGRAKVDDGGLIPRPGDRGVRERANGRAPDRARA